MNAFSHNENMLPNCYRDDDDDDSSTATPSTMIIPSSKRRSQKKVIPTNRLGYESGLGETKNIQAEQKRRRIIIDDSSDHDMDDFAFAAATLTSASVCKLTTPTKQTKIPNSDDSDLFSDSESENSSNCAEIEKGSKCNVVTPQVNNKTSANFALVSKLSVDPTIRSGDDKSSLDDNVSLQDYGQTNKIRQIASDYGTQSPANNASKRGGWAAGSGWDAQNQGSNTSNRGGWGRNNAQSKPSNGTWGSYKPSSERLLEREPSLGILQSHTENLVDNNVSLQDGDDNTCTPPLSRISMSGLRKSQRTSIPTNRFGYTQDLCVTDNGNGQKNKIGQTSNRGGWATGSGWDAQNQGSNTSNRGGWGRSNAQSKPSNGTWGSYKPSSERLLEREPSLGILQSQTEGFRRPVTASLKKILPVDLIIDNETLEIIDVCRDQFILRYIFKGRIKIQKVTKKTAPIEATRYFGGDSEYHLVATKFEKGQGRGRYSASMADYIKAYFVEGTEESIRTELEGLAGFSELWDDPGKLAARMELLVSPACYITNGDTRIPCIYNKDTSDFEILSEEEFPENKTMGCGFIPKDMLVTLLGGGKKAENAVAVQARIVSPALGIFKGMLVTKPGIDKIQLPLSLKKVGRAQKRNKKRDKKTYLLFNNICPSQNNENLERFINPNISESPTKSATSELQGFSEQMQKLLLQCGVDEETIYSYNERAETWLGHGHTSLYGVCDCTDNGLPPGSVYIPGLFPNEKSNRKVLITRSPCTEETDLVLLPVVTAQPKKMKSADWSHLCNLPLGIIMFASPKDATEKSLPELINNSDLDGDRFCVIYDESILNCLKHKTLNPGRQACSTATKQTKYNVGDSVEAKWGDGKYYPGLISRVCGPNVGVHEAYNITFYDADTLNEATLDIIRPLTETNGIEEEMIWEVVDHRGTGKNLEVQVKVSDSQNVWKKVSSCKGLYTYELATYAAERDLVDNKDWDWAKRYVRDAEIVEIRDIKYTRKKKSEPESCMATVLYDGEPKLTCVDANDIDIDLLSKLYYKKRDIKIIPNMLATRIRNASDEWFTELQETLRDLPSLSDHNLLVTRLNSEYKNKQGKHCAADVQALGRAYKLANDIGKHGGRVPLPAHLRTFVVQKKIGLNNFIKDI